jgi:molybdopterin molybdotransferase
VRTGVEAGRFVRPPASISRQGETLLRAGQRLDSGRLALAAAMGHARFRSAASRASPSWRTGDELAWPGEAVGPTRSSPRTCSRSPRWWKSGRRGDRSRHRARHRSRRSIGHRSAEAQQADLLVTLGRASVGDHDLVQAAFRPARHGARLLARRAAAGQADDSRASRPNARPRPAGNPVSSIVCAILFVVPALRALLGRTIPARDPAEPAVLGRDLPANDGRQDYLRASIRPSATRCRRDPLRGQDSSMLAVWRDRTPGRSPSLGPRPRAPAISAA